MHASLRFGDVHRQIFLQVCIHHIHHIAPAPARPHDYMNFCVRSEITVGDITARENEEASMKRLALSFAQVLQKHFEETDEEAAPNLHFSTLMFTFAYSEKRDMYMDDIRHNLNTNTADVDIRLLKSFIDQPDYVAAPLVELFLKQLAEHLR